MKRIDIQTYLRKGTLKVTQYADDTCLLLRNNRDVNAALKVLETFTAVSGLQLNLSKTEGLGIGTFTDINITPDSKIKWTQTPIRYLGIYIGHNSSLCEKLNWSTKLEEFKKKLLDSWRTRNITLQGRYSPSTPTTRQT